MVILFCPKSSIFARNPWMVIPRYDLSQSGRPTDDPDGKEGKDARTGMFVQVTVTNQGKPRRFSHEH